MENEIQLQKNICAVFLEGTAHGELKVACEFPRWRFLAEQYSVLR